MADDITLVTSGPVTEVLQRGDWVEREPYPWGPGPWDDEPDRVRWTDDATGLDCMVLRGHMGQWNGYVRLPEGHPLIGQEADFEVHGGITFCGTLDEKQPEGFWIGFDCAHAWDVNPFLDAFARSQGREPIVSRPPMPATTYKDINYAIAEVVSLAKQVKEHE